MKIRSCLLLIVILAASSVASAADHPQITFKKIKALTTHARAARLIVDSTLPSDLRVFSSNDHAEGCIVFIHSDLARGLRSDLLAVLMAHELAHCELDHHAQARDPALDRRWELEYEADALIVRLTRRLQIDARTAFLQLMAMFPDGPDHPPGRARVQALNGGARMFAQEIDSATARNAEQ